MARVFPNLSLKYPVVFEKIPTVFNLSKNHISSFIIADCLKVALIVPGFIKISSPAKIKILNSESKDSFLLFKAKSINSFDISNKYG